MYKPEIRFNGPQYDGVEYELGGLERKLVNMVNDHGFNTLGKNSHPYPTDIEITPHVIDEPKFLVRSWHETAAPAGKIGVLQMQVFEMSVETSSEEVFLTTDAESSPSYLLTTREAFLLMGIGAMAAVSSFERSPTLGQE